MSPVSLNVHEKILERIKGLTVLRFRGGGDGNLDSPEVKRTLVLLRRLHWDALKVPIQYHVSSTTSKEEQMTL